MTRARAESERMILHLDFETRSTLELPDVGLDRYAAHPTTDAWCMAWAFDEDAPQVLTGEVKGTGQQVVKGATQVKIGFKLQQITDVNQRSENYSVAGTLGMVWQDPQLARGMTTCIVLCAPSADSP